MVKISNVITVATNGNKLHLISMAARMFIKYNKLIEFLQLLHCFRCFFFIFRIFISFSLATICILVRILILNEYFVLKLM